MVTICTRYQQFYHMEAYAMLTKSRHQDTRQQARPVNEAGQCWMLIDVDAMEHRNRAFLTVCGDRSGHKPMSKMEAGKSRHRKKRCE